VSIIGGAHPWHRVRETKKKKRNFGMKTLKIGCTVNCIWDAFVMATVPLIPILTPYGLLFQGVIKMEALTMLTQTFASLSTGVFYCHCHNL
jgi:hypothetical protein